MRRARSARENLVGFGLDPAAFTVDSMGEDRPLDPGRSGAFAIARRALALSTKLALPIFAAIQWKPFE